MNELLIAIGGASLTVGLFALCIWFIRKDQKKRWAAIDPENARKMYYHGTDITGVRGDFFVRVSDWQWLQIFWDKEKKELTIQRPPRTWWHHKNHPIWIREVNWQVVREQQPVRTTVEKYFVRQVM